MTGQLPRGRRPGSLPENPGLTQLRMSPAFLRTLFARVEGIRLFAIGRKGRPSQLRRQLPVSGRVLWVRSGLLVLAVAGFVVESPRPAFAQANPDAAADADAETDDLFGDEDDADLFADDELFSDEDQTQEEAAPPRDPVVPIVQEEEPESELLEEALRPRSELPSSGIEEILIQGQATGTDEFDTTDSVTAFGAEDLQALGVQDVSDLSAATPNLEIRVQSATSPTFFVRGVGLADFSANAPGAVAVYQDDVARNAPPLQLGTVFDVETINVLRGPQGTGPSRNASAGAIKIYSNKPTGDFSASLRSTYGNYNFQDFEGHVEAPIFGDVLSARIAFRSIRRDGYLENGCAGAPRVKQVGVRQCGESVGSPNEPPQDQLSMIPAGLDKNLNDRGRWAARGLLRFQPVNYDMEWLLGIHGSRLNETSRVGQAIGTLGTQRFRDENGVLVKEIRGRLGGSAGVGDLSYTDPDVTAMSTAVGRLLRDQGVGQPLRRELRDLIVAKKLAQNLDPEPYRGDYNKTGNTRLDTWGGYLRGDLAIGSLNLKTITGFDAYERSTDTDQDFTPNVLFENRSNDRLWQATQELELSGELGDSASWTAGTFVLIDYLDAVVRNEFDTGAASFVNAGRQYSQEQQSLGVYGSFVWDFLDDFTLDGGIRYNWHRSRIDFELDRAGNIVTNVETETWDHPTGTLRLTYHFTDEIDIFTKYSHGWKSGYFNATASLRKRITAAGPEKIDSWESGVRGSWFDSRLSVEAAAFYYRYADYQVFQVDQEFGSPPEVEVINASDAENYGAELELMLEPLEGLILTARAAWLESKFLDFSDPQFVQKNVALDPNNPGDLTLLTFQIDENFSGNRLINSPQYSLSLSALWNIDLGRYGTLQPRYDGSWVDDVYFDSTQGKGVQNGNGDIFLPDNTLGQEAHWTHNVRLAYTLPSGNVEIAGWVRNLEDDVIKVGGFNASTFQNLIINFVGEPRTYGIDVRLTF